MGRPSVIEAGFWLRAALCLVFVMIPLSSPADGIEDLSLGDLLNMDLTIATKTARKENEAPSGRRKRSGEKKFQGLNLVKVDDREPVDSALTLNTTLTFEALDSLGFFKGACIQISGYNLLDEKIRDPDFSTDIENDLPAAGRSFLFRLSYHF